MNSAIEAVSEVSWESKVGRATNDGSEYDSSISTGMREAMETIYTLSREVQVLVDLAGAGSQDEYVEWSNNKEPKSNIGTLHLYITSKQNFHSKMISQEYSPHHPKFLLLRCKSNPTVLRLETGKET